MVTKAKRPPTPHMILVFDADTKKQRRVSVCRVGNEVGEVIVSRQDKAGVLWTVRCASCLVRLSLPQGLPQ